jgi:hypothetical protein
MSSQAVLKDINQALEEIGSLHANWDSYGAPSITKSAIKAAKGLLNTLVNAQAQRLGDAVRPYSLVPLASGGIQLTWRSLRTGELEVEVGPDGQLGYLLVPPEGLQMAVEQDDVSPKTVVALVARVIDTSSSQHSAD